MVKMRFMNIFIIILFLAPCLQAELGLTIVGGFNRANVLHEESEMELADTISSMPTKGLGYTKKLLSQTFNNSLEDQLSLEAEIQKLSASSKDHQEGIKAFMEKRTPQFTGK